MASIIVNPTSSTLDEYPSVPSRFEHLITQTSFLDVLLKNRKAVQGTNTTLRTKPPKPAPALKGTVPTNPAFSGKLYFAPAYHDMDTDEGTPWSEPMPNPKPNKLYYVSLEISQLQGDGPLTQLQGFRTHWFHPPGWSWQDGLADFSYDEAITNPLYIRRRVKAPAKIGSKGFKVIVDEVYRP